MEAVHTIFPFDGLITNLMDTKMQNYTWYRNCVSSLYWETVQFIEKLILLIGSSCTLSLFLAISNAFLFKLIEEWNLTFPFVIVRLASLDNITWWRDKNVNVDVIMATVMQRIMIFHHYQRSSDIKKSYQI